MGSGWFVHIFVWAFFVAHGGGGEMSNNRDKFTNKFPGGGGRGGWIFDVANYGFCLSVSMWVSVRLQKHWCYYCSVLLGNLIFFWWSIDRWLVLKEKNERKWCFVIEVVVIIRIKRKFYQNKLIKMACNEFTRLNFFVFSVVFSVYNGVFFSSINWKFL